MKKGLIVSITGVCSFGIGFFFGGKMLVGMINDSKRGMKRSSANMLVFHDWIEFIYNGGHIDKYLNDNDYSKVMIYGGGYVGRRLKQALENANIEVTAVMDKMNANGQDGAMLGVDDKVPDVDCIIITPVSYYDEIYNMLQKRTKIPVISIEKLWRE